MTSRLSLQALYADIGVVAAHGHAELERKVRDEGADGAEAYHAEALAAELRAGEGALALLDEGRDGVALVGDGVHPVNRAQHIAAREEHIEDYHLLRGVGVRARRVEDDYALFGAVLDRDVVDARARAAYAQELGAELRAVQVGGAYEQGLGVLDLLADGAAVLLEYLRPQRGDGVHCAYLKHGASPQNPSCSRREPSRPRAAWRCKARPSCPR